MENTIIDIGKFSADSYPIVESQNGGYHSENYFLGNDNETNFSPRNTPIDAYYELIDDDDITNRIIDLYIEFLRRLLKTGLSLSKDQLNTCLHIIKEMTSYIPRLEKISIQKTVDNEIQLTRRIPRGYVSLIVDEFGGVTYLVMREKGFGYKCEYFDADELDKRTIYNLSKNFHSI